MYSNEFTTNDANYWDKLHYNETAGLKVEKLIVKFWMDRKVNARYFKAL